MSRFDDSHISEILKGRRAVRRVPFPGAQGHEIGIRLLTDREIDDAKLEAHRYLERRCRESKQEYKTIVELDEDMLKRAVEQELLFRAIVDADSTSDKPEPFFASPTQLREQCDSVTVRSLLDLYLDHQETVVPEVTLSDEDVEKLVDALGKEHEPQGILVHFAPSTLRLFVRSMANRLRGISPTGRSSTGPSSAPPPVPSSESVSDGAT